MKNGFKTFSLKIVLRVTLKIFLIFYPFPLFSQKKKVAYPFYTLYANQQG